VAVGSDEKANIGFVLATTPEAIHFYSTAPTQYNTLYAGTTVLAAIPVKK
jgi:hypothetical protein